MSKPLKQQKSKQLDNVSTGNVSNTPFLDLDMSIDNKVSQKIDCVGKMPTARFGHTLTLVSSAKIVMFGGAIGDTKNFTFTNETYILNIMTKIWSKIECKDIIKLSF